MVTRESLVDVKKLFIIFLFCIVFNIIPCIAILCGDEQCKEIISLAKTVNNYGSRGSGTISFKANKEVSVYGKEAGKNKELFLVKIDGQLGYAPRNLIQETRILKRELIDVAFKLPIESTQKEKPTKKQSTSPDPPQKPTIVDSASPISSSTPHNTQHSSDDKTESHSSSHAGHELKTDTASSEGESDNVIKDIAGENENFTVDDLNQYSLDHVDTKSVNHGVKVEQQTSERLSEQDQNINLDHQELNIPSSTKVEEKETHPSSTSSPPDHVNFQSDDKIDKADSGTDQVVIEPSVDQPLPSAVEHCKSSIVFEGTTICEEYYDSTQPSESAVIDEPPSQSVFVYTSTQLYPSTESTTSFVTPVNSPDLPATDIVGSDAPSFVSSVDSQSLLGSSLEHLESATETLQPSQPADTLKFESQSSAQQSESVATASANLKETETSIEGPAPTDEPSTLSKLTNYVKTVFTSIGSEETDNKEVEENVDDEVEQEEEDGGEEDDDDETGDGDEEDEDEIDGTELPVYFPEKETNADNDETVNKVPTQVDVIKEENSGEKSGNSIGMDSSISNSVQNSEISNNDASVSDSKSKRETKEVVSNSEVVADATISTDSLDTTLKNPNVVINSDSKPELDVLKSDSTTVRNEQTMEGDDNMLTPENEKLVEENVGSSTAESEITNEKTMENLMVLDSDSSRDDSKLDGSHSNLEKDNKDNFPQNPSSKKNLEKDNKVFLQNSSSQKNLEKDNKDFPQNPSSQKNLEKDNKDFPQNPSSQKNLEKDNKDFLQNPSSQTLIKENVVPEGTTGMSNAVNDNEKGSAELSDSQLDKTNGQDTIGQSDHSSSTLKNGNTISQDVPSTSDEILNTNISESKMEFQAESIEETNAASADEVNTPKEDATAESNDSPLPSEGPLESKSGLEKSSASVEGEIRHPIDTNISKDNKEIGKTNSSTVQLDGTRKIKEEKVSSVHIVKETFSTSDKMVDVTVHESSKNEIAKDSLEIPEISVPQEHSEAVKDTMEMAKVSVLQEHSDFLSGNSDPNIHNKFDLFERPTNSEVNADAGESNIDVAADTKSTLLDSDAIAMPLSDKEINDEITVGSTESTRTILSFEEENSESDYVEDHLMEDTSDGIVGIFWEYIGLFPVYLQIIIDVLPLPVQRQLSEWEKNGLSPRVTVVTWITAAFTSVVCICTILIQRRSKEQMLIGKLGTIEQKMFTVSTERDVLKEELNTLKHQAALFQKNLLDQQSLSVPLQQELEEIKNENRELLNNVETATYQVEMLQTKLVSLQKLADTTDEMNKDFMEKLGENERILLEMEQNLQKTCAELSEEREQNEELKLSKDQLATQVYQLESTCSQLLQEAQVWNERVNELTSLLETEKQECEELKSTVKLKETEIKGLQNTMLQIKLIEENVDLSEEDGNENLKNLMDASLSREQLREIQEEKSSLQEELKVVNEIMQEKEGQLSTARNEIEKLKHSYNQALQDKMEAQTKLDVLTNYFKEKEVQLQKELGVQEAMRQQKEEDASSASNRIALIEQENISYKHQLATLKQELEETERGYKNQVAMHEKKAHENWLAARSSERKLDEAKQETSQLRQRLTLLEREQENWGKAEVDGVVRPVPKRYLSPNGEVPFASNKSIPQQSSVEIPDNSSPALPLSRGILEPGKIPNPPLLPMDRPVPPPALHPMDPRFPLPPPPFLPPPFGERLPPHFMDLWRFPPPPLPPMHRRMSPQDYDRGRLPTPPNSVTPPYERDRDLDRHSINSRETFDRRPPLDRFSPPLRDAGSRDSRNSSPPHMLPHFHDNPPPRPYGFPLPPMLPPRYTSPPPPPPLHRREPYFPPSMPLDQRAVDRSKDPATNSPRHSHERTPPSEAKTTATAV